MKVSSVWSMELPAFYEIMIDDGQTISYGSFTSNNNEYSLILFILISNTYVTLGGNIFIFERRGQLLPIDSLRNVWQKQVLKGAIGAQTG